MEHRKIIKFGKSSYVISLPNEWVKKNKLEKGDTIYCENDKKDELTLKVNNNEEEKNAKIVINTKGKDDERIEREIISAYINDYSTIEVIGGIIEVNQIEEIVHNLIGLDIIEQTSSTIIIKNFLELKDISIKDSMRRLDTTVRSILIDSKECISGNMSYEEIYRRDFNVNKTRILIFKLLRHPAMISKIEKEFEKEEINILDLFFLNFNLELIADEATRIAKHSNTAKLSKEERNNVRKIFEYIEASYLEVMKGFYKRDKEFAHKAASEKYKIIDACRELLEKTTNKYTVQIVENLKGMERGVRDITRLVIDLK